MLTSDNMMSYATFCGNVLDDMLEQIIHNVISRSLLDEKLTRKDYGTIRAPIFHDPPSFGQTDAGNENSEINPINIDDDTTDGKEDAADENGNIDNIKHHKHTKLNKLNKVNKNYKKKDTSRYTEPDIGRFQFVINGKDIYVNALDANRKLLGDKASLLTLGTAQDLYFKCSNCDRKIAGSRFSGHIDKCLGGRSRK